VLRSVDLPKPVLAKVEERHTLHGITGEVAGRARHQDLTSVGGAGDPCRPHDVEAVVSGLRETGLAGVDADADPHCGVLRPPLGADRSLGLDCRPDSIARPTERVEERVALGVDLVAAGRVEPAPQERVVLLQQPPVVVAELLDKGRRAFDVRKDEGDRSGGDRRLDP